MKHRIAALALAALLIVSVFSACARQASEADGTPAAVSGGESGQAGETERTQDFVYTAEYPALPAGLNSIGSSCVSGGALYYSAYVSEGDAALPRVYRLDLSTKESTLLLELPAGDSAAPEAGVSYENAYLQGMCPAPDGGVWLLTQNARYHFDLPADFDAAGANAYDYYADDGSAYHLTHCSPDGAAVQETELDAQTFSDASDGSFISSMLSDSKGNLYLSNWDNAWLFDAQANFLTALSLDSAYGVYQLSADEIGVIRSADYTHGTSSFQLMDPASRDWGQTLQLPAALYQLYPGDDAYRFYYDVSGSLYGCRKDSDAPEKVIDWLSCDIDSNNLSSFHMLPDGRIAAVSSSGEGTPELILLSRVDAASVPQKTELTLACYGLDWNLRSQIVQFNKQSSQYRIVVHDYAEDTLAGNGGLVSIDGSSPVGDGLAKLSTEIMSGNIPDILITSSLPVQQYAAKGLLEDLNSFLQADAALSRESFITEVLDAAEIDGKLYEIPISFSVSSAVGLSSVVGGYDSWTLEDLKDAMTKLQPDATIFNVGFTKADVLSYCVDTNASAFIDWNSKTASFDSQDFIDYLNFADSFPLEFDSSSFDWETDYESDYSRIRQGKQLLSISTLAGFDDTYVQFTALGDDPCFIGLPSRSGTSGNSFLLGSGLAITTACRDRDAAWGFIRTLLGEQFQESLWYQLPILKAAFEKKAAEAMVQEYETDAEGKPVLDADGKPIKISTGGFSFGGSEVYEVYAMTQEQYDTLLSLIRTTTQVTRYDQSILDIINDETGAFFAGEKSAEETAALIQSRVSLYMAEQG